MNAANETIEEALTRREAVRLCIEKIGYGMNNLSARFYTHLSELDPEQMQKVFDGTAVTLTRKFVNMLATFKSIRRLEQMEAAIEGLAKRHIAYGLRLPYLPPFKQAMMNALADHLGERFDDTLRKAWSDTWDEVVGIMQRAIENNPEWESTRKEKNNAHQDVGLLDLVGGPEVVRRVHSRFYDVIFEEPWLGQFFYGKSKPALIHKQTTFMVAAFGGPNEYHGEPPAIVHMHMLITEEMAERREVLLRRAIASEGLSQETADRWLAVDKSFWPAINKTSEGECVTKCFGQVALTVKKPEGYMPGM